MSSAASLVEFADLKYTVGVDSAWSLRRVGASGVVILLRATKADGDLGTVLSVKFLSGERDSVLPLLSLFS